MYIKYILVLRGGNSYDYKYRILKDTLIGNKRYFLFSSGSYVRYDSLTGNIYFRGSTGYCSYSPFEVLSDSLKAIPHDSFTVCNSAYKSICSGITNQNIFGQNRQVKLFIRPNFEGSTSNGYVYGIRFYTTLQDFLGIGSYSLIGAYINGVLYGDTTLTSINQISQETPKTFSLSQNFPNPFNPNTKIKFDIPKSNDVSIIVYDLLGKEIETLLDKNLLPGTYEITFDGSNYSSCVYFYRLATNGFSETKRMLLLK